MDYKFETLQNDTFVLACDPQEKLQAVVQRVALKRDLTADGVFLSFNGKKLAATSTLGEEGVDCRQDVVMVHSRGTKRAASELDEEARLQEARDTQQTAAAAVESLEAVRDQIEAKREELSRPVFVSKKQRERLRKDAKKEASKASKTSHAELQKKREEAFEEAKKAGATLERQEQQQAKRARTEAKGKGGVQEPSELDQLKERYLRSKPATKKVVKVHELSKVPDTWDNTDDTSRGSTWGADTGPVNLLFGRGFTGGEDAEQQLQERGGLEYEELVKRREERELQKKAEIMTRRRANKKAAEALEREQEQEGEKEGEA